MLSAQELWSASEWLRECRRPLLVTHRRPDGDALGAVAAMAAATQLLGCDPLTVLFDALPNRYRGFNFGVRWHQWEESREVLAAECDSVVIVDTCALAQLEPIIGFLQRAPQILVIDHHVTRDAIGTRPDDLRLIDETAAATCVLVHEWMRAAELAIDENVAQWLFMGIATDCGWFRYSNTDARTMRAAADLVERGVVPAKLHDVIFQREPLEKLRLVAHALSKMEMLASGKLAVIRLRAEDFRVTGADRSMTEDLVNEALRLSSVEATLLVIEENDEIVRANFRSKEKLDVAEVARRFGGGGHARAAGARLQGKWDYVVPRLVAEMVDAL